jgi:hypothetical protein
MPKDGLFGEESPGGVRTSQRGMQVGLAESMEGNQLFHGEERLQTD